MSSLSPSRKKTLYNAFMVAAIVLILGGAIAFVGSLQGWFSGGLATAEAEYPEARLVAQNKVGNVNIERSGIAYALEDGDELRDEDIVETLSGSSIEIAYGDDMVETIGERCEVVVHIDEDSKVSFQYVNGSPASEGDQDGAESASGESGDGSQQDGDAASSGAIGAAGALAGASSNGGSGDGSAGSSSPHCTISIDCAAILNNLSELAPGKDRFVPPNGVILASSTVAFKEGDSAFDVLKRTCATAGIQLEYSYTPVYESYYIEGINQIYEFDCGDESGWVYQVNGVRHNIGCSSYTIKDGDVITWTYTCKV